MTQKPLIQKIKLFISYLKSKLRKIQIISQLIFEDQKLSYKDLNKKSNQLARLIRAKYKKQNKKDLKPDSLIGLCVERSLRYDNWNIRDLKSRRCLCAT